MGHILNGMSDSLFDIYQSSIFAKELYEKLESRYMQEYATSKKFLVSQFNNYKMVDNKSVMEQMHETGRILNNYKQHQMHMNETIIVSCIIDKLPPSWKDFKKSMKHKKYDISLEILGNHLRLEEEYRKQEDSGATSHVCKNKELFKTIDEEDGSILYTRNASTVQVKGKGTVEIEFTSGKILTLKDVFYVPTLQEFFKFAKFGMRSLTDSRKVVVCNIHVLYNPNRGEIKLGQEQLQAEIGKTLYPNEAFVNVFGKEHLGYVRCMGLEITPSQITTSTSHSVRSMSSSEANEKMEKMQAEIDRLKKRDSEVDMLKEQIAFLMQMQNSRDKQRRLGTVTNFADGSNDGFVNRRKLVSRRTNLRQLQNRRKHQTAAVSTAANPLFNRRKTSDRGEEFYHPGYFESTSIVHQTAAPYSPQQNEIAERKNRVLEEMVNDMLSYSGLSKEPRRSKRARKEKDYGLDFFMFLVEGTNNFINSYGPICYNLESDTDTYEEAIKSQDSSFWKEAIQEEMDLIMGNKTWKLVDLHPRSKPIVLEGYTDASWVTYVEDHASTSGCIFNLGGGAVYWGSKKQTCIDDSTMAAEFIALAAGRKEAE
ncbi:uncharacterized protein [Cicer arietinum]|uniref:uncharacterized protein n=1 Tax=Cicer arietinum TaxID=3827 RepID=UPI003CC55DE1